MTVGGVLRVTNVGPGGLTTTPTSLVSCAYEAGVHDCRLLNPGNLTVKVTDKPEPFSFDVVIVS